MEGEDEREGLGLLGELGPSRPKLHKIEGMEGEVIPQTSDSFRVQSGAIVSREKTSLLGDQLSDICQNVNSFIGHLDDQNSKLSTQDMETGFGLSNVGLSDNSVSEISNRCNNDINFNSNSVQNRTQYFSNSQGFTPVFSNNIPQRHMSETSHLDQTIAPFHSVNPSVSGIGLSRESESKPIKSESEMESTNKTISNKRRLLGGVSIGAPAPKIKRKRQNVPEPKHFARHTPVPAPTTSLLPLPTFNDIKPSLEPQSSQKPSFNPVPIFPNEDKNKMETEQLLTEVPLAEQPLKLLYSTIPTGCQSETEILHVPESNYENVSSNINTQLSVQSNNNAHLGSEPVQLLKSSDSEGNEVEVKRPSVTDIPCYEHQREEMLKDHSPISERDLSEKSVQQDYFISPDKDFSRSSNMPSEFDNSDRSDNVALENNDNIYSSTSHFPSFPSQESLSESLSSLNNCETQCLKPSLPEENIQNTENLNFEYEKSENVSTVFENSQLRTVTPEPDFNVDLNVEHNLNLETSDTSFNAIQTENAELTVQGEQTKVFNSQITEREDSESDRLNNALAGTSPKQKNVEISSSSDIVNEKRIEVMSDLKQEMSSPVCNDADPLATPSKNSNASKDQYEGNHMPNETNTEAKPKSKDKRYRDGKMSSDEDEANSDTELRKWHMKRRPGGSGLSAKPKVKNLRRNIREIISDDKLEENTIVAQKEEQLRLQRLQEKRLALREYMEQQQVERLVAEVAEAAEAVTAAEAVEEVEAAEMAAEAAAKETTEESDNDGKARSDDSDIVVLSSEEEEGPEVKDEESESESTEEEALLKPKKEIKSENEESMEDSDQKSKSSEESESESDSDVVVLSHSEDEEDTEDVNNSGAHINDEFNVPDAQGRVLVNVGHPENEEDIFLAPQLSMAAKPHQIGGIRFLYDNIVESIEQFKTSNGFGCILAHSMGLGKTLQVVSLTDIFLRHTDAKTVLIIVPINTLQNWQAEYNQWLPEERPPMFPEDMEIHLRTFRVFILNDAQKNLQARFKVINQWHEQGGILLMGYELYRQLSLKKPKKPKKKKKRKDQLDSEVVDIEEEDKNKELLDEMQKALVRPGPDLVICDEGHRIKNAHANISQALKNIRTKRRVVLTGYPLQNNLLEYWCMVDFIRPNYLGTKTEFCNMFERPIQNGQCVDSTPQDVKIMRYRAHVLHSLLEGFVQRRGHSVLAKSLPTKQENVLLCRMTKIQRTLYSAYMAELKVNKAVANPLKAFAVCCKIWNHPDVLYNFVMKRMNEDFDLDLDEVVGKVGKSKKYGKFEPIKGPDTYPSFQHNPLPSWNPSNPTISRSGIGMPAHPPPMNMASMPGMGMQNNMNQQGTLPPPMMLSGMGLHGMGAHNQDSSQQQHHNMGMGRDSAPHPGMGMGNYGMGMFGMQQNYGMHQMPPPYSWGYNQGYPPNPNDPTVQHYPPSPPYGSPYGPPQYQQSHHMQQQQQQPLPMAHHQQPMPPSQGIPGGYPAMPSMMHNSMGMGPPPAHPSMHQTGHPLNASQQNSQQMHDPSMQGLHQQSALNLSHQANNPNMHSQNTQEIQSHQNSHSMMNQNSPSMLDQSTQNLHSRATQNLTDQQSNPPSMQPDQSNQSLPHNLSNQQRQDGISQQDFSTAINQSNSDNFPKLSLENLSSQQNVSDNSFQTSQDNLSSLLNQNMKDLGIDDKPATQDEEMLDSKDSLSSLLAANDDKTPASPNEVKPPTEAGNSSSEDKIKGKSEEEGKEDDKGAKSDDSKGEKAEEDEKKDDKKEDPKKDELSFEWAENLFKDYVPGLIESSTKFQIFFKILEGTLIAGDRLLVFSQSLFTLTMLEEFLQKSYIPGTYEGWTKSRTYFRLDGSTSAQEREKLINEFNNNPQIYLFLVSTRAGSLGINLVGANRVVVFDASFNPCHDTQAVCRVYRYGQTKPCHIYRLVTDNSLERRIYDRQVNKQGIADRIVDEMNPEAHLSSKEISNLLVDNEEDPEPEDMVDKEDSFEDEILKEIVKEKGIMFTRLPFRHESLLIDRKDKKLSNAEKRLAKRSYELEKQANISYSRPSYSSFYPKNSASQTVMMGTKIGGIVYAKPVGTVRPMQAEMSQKIEGGGAMMHRPNILSRSQSSFPVESLAKQGVSVQQITVPKDVSIPTNSGDGKPIHLKAGQSVMVIKTQKGMYLRLSDGKIIAIRTPPEEAFGLPLNQGSVTIVPTMISSPRPRGGGRGGLNPTRRGRPPMSAQYALGQVIPKGTSKGQMAVRILRKPIISSRGGKTYQTIAVPVSSTGQGALLNKSVVITPAKSGGSSQKFLKDLKISPKVQIMPVPTKSRSSLTSIAGTSGLTKRLNRNNKIISAQAMAMKNEEEKRQKEKAATKKEGEPPGEEGGSSFKSSSEESNGKPDDSKSKEESKQDEAMAVDGQENKEAESQNADNGMETDAQKDTSEQQQQPQLSQTGSQDDLNHSLSHDINSTSSPMGEQTPVANIPVSEESLSQKDSPASSIGLGAPHYGMNSAPSSVGSPVISEKGEDLFKGTNSSILPMSHENRPLTLSTASEPITGIVKPLVHQNLPQPTVTPLQGLSNLVPPDEGGPGPPPSSQSSFSTPGMTSLPQVSSFSQNFSSSQPLFQPFLQQTLPTSSSSSVSTPGSGSSDVRGLTWVKSQAAPHSLVSSSLASNVAHVAPHIQSSAADLTSQSSFLSSPGTSFTSTTSAHSPMHSLQSLAAPHPQGPLSFPGMGDSANLSQTHANSISASSVSSTSPSPLSTATLSTSISQGGDGPLSLSNLLPSQPYTPQSGPDDLLPHHSSALDYLNYSLTASSSAFRRPEFPSPLPTDIQSLLNAPPPTASQLPSSTHPSTQSTTSPTVSTPGTFSPQTSAYSQYASSYRSHAATPGGFRTPPSMPPGYPPYPTQYGPYASQYPNLSPHPAATPQTPPMGQYGGLQSPTNPYQGYPPPPTGAGIPPYSSGLGGFGHGPYPPM